MYPRTHESACLFEGTGRPIVFAGPSLAELTETVRAQIDLRGPAARGSLEALIDTERPGTAVLIDGLFGASMAVTPTECRHLLEAGWQLIGASSIGALRASEMWSVGMVGVGEVYLMLRLHLLSDAEVAVAYHPDEHRELTASLVHVRSILGTLEREGLDAALCDVMLEEARAIYWGDRSWPELLDVWRRLSIPDTALARAKTLRLLSSNHPKQRDAKLALQLALARRWPG